MGKMELGRQTYIVSCPPRLEYQVFLQPGGSLVLEFFGQCLHAVVFLVLQQGPHRLQVLFSQVGITMVLDIADCLDLNLFPIFLSSTQPYHSQTHYLQATGICV